MSPPFPTEAEKIKYPRKSKNFFSLRGFGFLRSDLEGPEGTLGRRQIGRNLGGDAAEITVSLQCETGIACFALHFSPVRADTGLTSLPALGAYSFFHFFLLAMPAIAGSGLTGG